MGALSNKGGRGQRNREEIGAREFCCPRLRRSCARLDKTAMLFRIKENSKRTSGNSLSSLVVQNKDLDAASQTLLYNRGKITSATQAKLKKMAEIVTNFASVDNIILDLHYSPDNTSPYPIMLMTKFIFVHHAGTGVN